MTSTAPVATGSNPLTSRGSSAKIEMKVEAHNATPAPTEAMNSQPRRVEPLVARARAKWRIPTQVPNRQTAPAITTRNLLIGKEVGGGEHDVFPCNHPKARGLIGEWFGGPKFVEPPRFAKQR